MSADAARTSACATSMPRRMAFHGAAALAALVAPLLCSGQGIITTVAGNGSSMYSGDGGPATSAGMNPYGVAVDGAGNIFIADLVNYRARKVNTSGIISTVAGCDPTTIACILAGLGDGGPATGAYVPLFDIAVDSAGSIYLADNGHASVRKVNSAGILSTVAGGGLKLGDAGPATSAKLVGPEGMVVDGAGNLYIADQLDNRVRKVDTAGIITTVAGNGTAGYSGDGGPGSSAELNNPHGLALDSAGNLYIADILNYRVRKLSPAGIITTVAGNGSLTVATGDGGPATSASVGGPEGVAVDGAGNIYISQENSRIRKVDPAGIITTIAGVGIGGFSGDGGPSTSAALLGTYGLSLDAAGNLYIADSGNNRIRKIAAAAPAPPSISANGVVNGASFQPGIVANSWATIQGSSLASTTDTWANFIVNGKLPTTLDGVTVTIGGKPAYLYYISPGQINFVAPDLPAGPAQVTVMTGAGTSTAFTVTASLYGPAFFPWPGNQAVATRQDFSFAVKAGTFAGATTVAAKPGDVIILWGTGFGPTTPPAPTGVQVPGNQTYSTSSLPSVTINNVAATVYGAALAPGFAGLYQVAIQVPASLADGDWPVVASIGGVKSPGGLVLSVKQ